MATSTFLSQLDTLAKKVESFAQSLPCAKIHPSKEQYSMLKNLSLRLADAAASIPSGIDALKKSQSLPKRAGNYYLKHGRI
jgi:hypothetical protein